MAVETFTFKRQAGAQGKITYRVKTAQFGDGYAQTVQDGINNKTQDWPLSFEGSIADMQPILDFFDRHGGHKSFWWHPPGSATPLLFRADAVNLTSRGGGVYQVTAEFKQVFNL